MSEVIEKIQQEEPTEEEISKYAEWLELDPNADEDLMWIAREGLRAELPEGWKPCRTEEGDVYYFDFNSGESMWDHPQDTYYKELARKEKVKKIQRLEKQKREQKKRDLDKKLGQVKTTGALAVVQPLKDLKKKKRQKLKLTADISSEDSESSLSAGADAIKRSAAAKTSKLETTTAKIKESKKELRQLKKSIAQLRSEEKGIKESVTHIRSEKQEFTAANEKLRSVHAQLTEDLKTSTQAMKKINSESAELTKQLNIKKEQFVEMSQSLQTAQSQRTDLREDLTSLNQTLTILRDQKKSMENELKELKENIEEQQFILEQQQKSIMDGSSSGTEAQNTSITMTSEKPVGEPSVNVSGSSLQHDTSIQLQERNKLKRELIDMREKLSSLQIRVSEHTATKSSLQRTIDELTQQRESLQSEYEKLRKERNELVSNSNSLQDELSTMTQNKMTLANKLTEMRKDEESLIDAVSQLRREEQHLRESIMQHRAQTLERESPLHIKPKSSPTSNLSKLSQDRKKIEKNIEKLRSEHETLTDDLEQKQRRLHNIQQEIREEELKHESTITAMTARIADLKRQIQDLEDQKVRYKQSVCQLETTIKRLKNQTKSLQQSVRGVTPESPVSQKSGSKECPRIHVHADSDSEQELSPLTPGAGTALREDDLLSLITSSLSPTFESKKLEQTVSSELERLNKVQQFVDQEKKLIRSKKISLEKARKEWKEDSEFNRGTVSDDVLMSVKELLERQTQEINHDIEQLNRIQSYVTLRRKQLKSLNEDFVETSQPERLFHKRRPSPLIEQAPGDRTIIRNTLDQLRKDIDQLHRVVDHTRLAKENVSPPTSTANNQERVFRTKWDNYFEEQRARFGGRIWDFQNQVRKWDEARSNERNLINSHEMWLRKFRRELQSEAPGLSGG
eukprot:CAMPEP_0117438552 /NCGR_PEP_ID=MMETSP0759-20121206/2111_1 /TAXON_ID=63605 /ORGANISM="Percolomonas cosmopolitus, Strain WS" /LENGTH=909 /DNA_ID=CAMNT_0005230245 /DNA_START=71 /DNA_END=2796 /DNA_ORIENTATION=+